MAEEATTAVVQRVLRARPEVVFDAWLDAEALADFICPAPTRAGTVEVEPRVGGRFGIEMVDEAAVVHVTGEYLEVDRPRTLRFTWDTDYGGGFDSVVTVTFAPHGDAGTLMTIEHAQLPAQWRDDHEQGWGTIAGQLERRLAE